MEIKKALVIFFSYYVDKYDPYSEVYLGFCTNDNLLMTLQKNGGTWSVHAYDS